RRNDYPCLQSFTLVPRGTEGQNQPLDPILVRVPGGSRKNRAWPAPVPLTGMALTPLARARRRVPRTVALVGIDGSGKTTQAHRLADLLPARGPPASYRQNAGGRRWFGRLAGALGRRDAEDLLGRRLMLVVESLLRWLAI